MLCMVGDTTQQLFTPSLSRRFFSESFSLVMRVNVCYCMRKSMMRLFAFLGVSMLTCLSNSMPSKAAQPAVRFKFREPQPVVYHVEDERISPDQKRTGVEWLRARPDGSTNYVELGSRVVLQLEAASDLKTVLQQSPLRLARTIAGNVFILQAGDAWAAVTEAQRLSAVPGVLASYPVARRAGSLHGAYSYTPADPYFYFQWYLERRDTNGLNTGMDLNVRAAWPYTRGEGVTLAVADVGVELTHPELAPRAIGAPHYNFNDQSTNAMPAGGTANWAHGTEVAGLAVAEANNGVGMAGVAPQAQLASWVIYTTNLLLVGDEQLMDMYQFRSDIVSVQNHSWGKPGLTQLGPTLLEQIGISNAVTYGRNG